MSPYGTTNTNSLNKELTIMTNIQRYTAADLPQLLDKMHKNSFGMDEYLDRVFNLATNTQNYPPYNIIHVNNVESRLEVALAGFKKEEVKAYTEYGKLTIKGEKESKENDVQYSHQGIAQRSFERSWQLSDDVEIKDVSFADGLLTIKLGKVVPDHHARKDFLK